MSGEACGLEPNAAAAVIGKINALQPHPTTLKQLVTCSLRPSLDASWET